MRGDDSHRRNVVRLMQRCERNQSLERGQDARVDLDRHCKFAPTVDHPVADGCESRRSQLAAQKFEEVRDRVAMTQGTSISPFLLVHDAVLRVPDVETGRALKTFDLTPKPGMRVIARVGIKRELEARRARVQNQNCVGALAHHADRVAATGELGTLNKGSGAALVAIRAGLASPAQPANRRQLRHRAGKLTFCKRDVRLGSPVLHRLFRKALRLERLGFVEIASADRSVRKHGHDIGLNFEKSALNVYDLLFRLARHLDAHDSGLDLSDERRVPRIDTELAHHARKHDELRVAGEDRLFGADDIDVNGIGHGFSGQDRYCSVFAFSTASSMPPRARGGARSAMNLRGCWWTGWPDRWGIGPSPSPGAWILATASRPWRSESLSACCARRDRTPRSAWSWRRPRAGWSSTPVGGRYPPRHSVFGTKPPNSGPR